MRYAAALLYTAIALGATPAPAQAADTLGEPGCLVVKPAGNSADRAAWSGPCKDGHAHGDGKLDWFLKAAPKGIFEGRMERGLPVSGYEKQADGAQYEGQYQDGLRHGAGTFVSHHDDRYTGAWKAGKRDGAGKATYSMGGGFEGQWRGDRPDGPGTVTYAGGRKAEHAERPPLFVQALTDETAKPETRRHDFKDGVPEHVTGSRVRRSQSAQGPVPFELGYEDLSALQKQKFRSQYPLLHQDDEPPYPLNGQQRIMRLMLSAQEARSPNGKLDLRVLVGANGAAKSVTVFAAPDAEIGEYATKVMMSQKFKPARCNGAPCEMYFSYNTAFETYLRLPP